MNIKLVDYIKNIFEYYKIKYKLKSLQLEILEYGNTCYRFSTDTIYINYNYDFLKESTFPTRINEYNKYNLIIASLLHELRHAIEAKSGLLQYEMTHLDFDRSAYSSQKYHDSVPFEKRADYFASIELNAWRLNV